MIFSKPEEFRQNSQKNVSISTMQKHVQILKKRKLGSAHLERNQLENSLELGLDDYTLCTVIVDPKQLFRYFGPCVLSIYRLV